MKGTYDKLVLVVIDGWNNKMVDYLGFNTLADALPIINEKSTKNKLKSIDSDTAVYLNLHLDNSTSTSAITKTMLVGNLPGLIEIPRQMYFNSSQVEYTNGHHKSQVIKLDEDNLLYRNHLANKGQAITVGTPVVQKSLRELFNKTIEMNSLSQITRLINENSKSYDFSEENISDNQSKISILMINYKVEASKSSDRIKKRFEEINMDLKKIISDLDQDTILAVTGNKAFYNKAKSKYNKDVIRREDLQNDETEIELDDKTKVKSVNMNVDGENVYFKNPYTGLFLYTKRKSKANYDFSLDESKELFKICPNPKEGNRINKVKAPRTVDKYGAKERPTSEDALVFFQFFNKFEIDGGTANPDTTHVLNLTSTFASLLGLSIPYSNIGSIIPHSYIFDMHDHCTSFYRNLALKYYNNLKQVIDYREKYYHGHKYFEHVTSEDLTESEKAEAQIIDNVRQDMKNVQEILETYNKHLKTEQALIKHLDHKSKFLTPVSGKQRMLEEGIIDKNKSEGTKQTEVDTSKKTEQAGVSSVDDKNNKTLLSENIKIVNETTPKLIELGGDQKKIDEKFKVPEKPNSQDLLDLKDYLLKCEKTTKNMFDHINLLSATIKEKQTGVDVSRFEIATGLLFLLLIILSIRVLAFIFDQEQNYKKLPTTAKQERIEQEQRSKQNRFLYVASNPQLILFAVATLFAFIFIRIYPFISCLIFSSVIAYKILEMIVKVVSQTKNINQHVNKKRKVISLACFIIG